MKSINFWAGSGGAEVRETCSLERECAEVPWATQAPDTVSFRATEHLWPQAFCAAGIGGDTSLREAWVIAPPPGLPMQSSLWEASADRPGQEWWEGLRDQTTFLPIC